MKFKLKCFTSLLCLFTFHSSYAMSSCENDVSEMSYQIAMYGSITTHDRQKARFDLVTNPVEVNSNTCKAIGYYAYSYKCDIQWDKGNWGNTFHCIR